MSILKACSTYKLCKRYTLGFTHTVVLFEESINFLGNMIFIIVQNNIINSIVYLLLDTFYWNILSGIAPVM
jgi:hypothetical protein